MKALVFIFVVLFGVTVAWRTVFVKKKDRRVIRFGLKELGIGLAVSLIGAAVLFFVLTSQTLRVL